MRTGELTESVRKRSVFRPLHLENNSICGCGRESLSGLKVSLAGPLPGYADMPWRQVTATANSLAADGTVPFELSLQGILPGTYEESALQMDMKQFAAEAKANHMEFCDADIQVSDSVSFPQYFVTGVGAYDNGENGIEENKIEKKYMRRINGEQPDDRRKEAFPVRQGMELIVTRQIGLAGTASLVRLHEEELLGKYPFQMVERAKGFDRWMSVTEAARAVNHFGSSHVYCIARGGIFNALWEMAEGAGVGLEVDIKKIPVKQETIEICEYFDVNPYYLYSEGSLLIATEQPEALLSMLRDADISACVIGRTTDGNDRLILNGESRRFLDRPKADELWRISG